LGSLAEEEYQMETISLRRNAALVLGAIMLGAVSPNLLYLSSNNLIRDAILFGVGVCLLLYGFGTVEKVLRATAIGLRKSRRLPPKIAILCGGPCGSSDGIRKVWTDITPEEWESEVQAAAKTVGKKIRTKLIRAGENLDSYSAVVNPFGGNYPETSFDGFPVYAKILEYVRGGGLFVNVADVPTYYAYNPRLKRELDRTPAVYCASGEGPRFFTRTPLMQELGLRVANVEVSSGQPTWPVQIDPQYGDCTASITNIRPSRAVLVEGNVDPVILPVDNMTPLFFCNYGDGRCLISLSFLDGVYGHNRPLSTIIARLIVNQLVN
jgi:hypothetical protein